MLLPCEWLQFAQVHVEGFVVVEDELHEFIQAEVAAEVFVSACHEDSSFVKVDIETKLLDHGEDVFD